MANSFKNAGAAIGSTRTVLYTCPNASEAVIHALFISNVDTSVQGTVNIEITVDGGTTYRHIGKNIPIPPESTLTLEKPINLEANDKIALTANQSNVLEVVASILEVN